ncbi:gp53-like domain-containing protein [Burkholderia ubonensis]|uniref:gp53-like domain-containing protein n=1 Tax=Burkholderia ubonensis TaxID=101571 RepID=UPI000BA5806E|nr:hypothetical protein [Burkholderia ubonensis]PAJ87926.1 hypothetical protein CJO70_08995 [Burkholderia ubonensis]PAJ97723.1 hypothetical protein CJO68_30030 [Burkholderia ubonensis]PAK08132.1 hypothetical protein CJO67_09235 [Burkholderia ubonensis]RQP80367.1 hypothetical protein DF014_21475 [Burkholderia ubonensis]RQP99601.1 hypothetical protein DF012_08125 [Burkholderia ubonensis]
MTDLVENSIWTPGIRQFETSDPVEGGPDGIDNVPLRQLANRTRFLKDAHDALAGAQNPYPQYATLVQLQSAIDGILAGAPGALDTLKELAAALGNDPNFATTILNALALKAALDSPTFTGTPKAPTPPQFDNSPKLATTAFVQAIGQQIPWIQISGATTLTAAQAAGKLVYLLGASGYTTTLPAAATMPAGTTVTLFNTSGAVMTVACSGTDTIGLNNPTAVATATLGNGDTMTLVSTGVAGTRAWQCVAGSILLGFQNVFASSLGVTGYQKLPSGLIIQWGAYTTSSSGDVSVTFPIAFTSGVYPIVTGVNLSGGQGGFTGITSNGSTGFTASGWNSSNARQTLGCWYIAIGL